MSTIILRKYIRAMLLEIDNNRGIAYEKKIQDILNQFCNTDFEAAGFSDYADAKFKILNEDGVLTTYGLEVKLNQNVFAGQRNLNFNRDTYDFSLFKHRPKSIKKQPILKEFTESSDVPAEPNTLTDYLNPLFDKDFIYKIIPRLEVFMKRYEITSFPSSMTMHEYAAIRADLAIQPVTSEGKETLELGKFPLDAKAIYLCYSEKNVHYIQVGKYGFYYLDNDIAKLDVQQFKPASVRLRTRLKWGGPSKLDPAKPKPDNENKLYELNLNCGIIFSGLTKTEDNLEGSLDFLNKHDKSKTNRK